jgi:5-formyltetrahydrofolate cyclo-ligase
VDADKADKADKADNANNANNANKKRLRQIMKQTLEAISPAEARSAGEAISDRLSEWSSWRTASVIGLFSTLRGEIDTRPWIERTLREDKQLLLPRMVAGRTLEFAIVETLESLQPGRYGVLEPDRSCPTQRLPAEALVFVPGIAFDREGGRLGRGAGHYDRALAACRDGSGRPRFIGVGFECQIVSEIPMSSLDIRMDGIMTESELVEVS